VFSGFAGTHPAFNKLHTSCVLSNPSEEHLT
jgi:hypothetical protein